MVMLPQGVQSDKDRIFPAHCSCQMPGDNKCKEQCTANVQIPPNAQMIEQYVLAEISQVLALHSGVGFDTDSYTLIQLKKLTSQWQLVMGSIDITQVVCEIAGP